VKALITSFGKLPIVLKKDVPGFVGNRFLMPMLIEAARLLEEGVASKEEIDLLVKKGISVSHSQFTQTLQLRFHALLGNDGAREVRFERTTME
jgi:3-hydroxyacyl-CoA dehydrogenase